MSLDKWIEKPIKTVNYMFWCVICGKKFYKTLPRMTREEYWKRNDWYTDIHDCTRSMFK